jgi:hypothetical protein
MEMALRDGPEAVAQLERMPIEALPFFELAGA